MKVLRNEPGELVNPNPSQWSPLYRTDPDTEYQIKFAHDKWNEGRQAERKAWQAQLVDVDLDEMAKRWVLSSPTNEKPVLINFKLMTVDGKTFTEYLKEKLEVKHDTNL